MAAPTDWITLAKQPRSSPRPTSISRPATIGGWARAGRSRASSSAGAGSSAAAEVRALVAAPRRVRLEDRPAGPVRGPRRLRPEWQAMACWRSSSASSTGRRSRGPGRPRHLRPRRRRAARQRPRVLGAVRRHPDDRCSSSGSPAGSTNDPTVRMQVGRRPDQGLPAARGPDRRGARRADGGRGLTSILGSSAWSGRSASSTGRSTSRLPGSSRPSASATSFRRTARGLRRRRDPGGRRSSGSSSSPRVASAFDALVARTESRSPARCRACSARSGSWSRSSMLAVLVVYRTLPPKAPRWRSALVPAVVVGIARRPAEPDLHVPGAAAGRRGRPRRLARVRLHRARVAVVHVPGAALRRGLGPRPRRVGATPGPSALGVPQRRQNRAVAESDSPQLTHGWTPPAGLAAARGRRPRGPTRPTGPRGRPAGQPAVRGTAGRLTAPGAGPGRPLRLGVRVRRRSPRRERGRRRRRGWRRRSGRGRPSARSAARRRPRRGGGDWAGAGAGAGAGSGAETATGSGSGSGSAWTASGSTMASTAAASATASTAADCLGLGLDGRDGFRLGLRRPRRRPPVRTRPLPRARRSRRLRPRGDGLDCGDCLGLDCGDCCRLGLDRGDCGSGSTAATASTSASGSTAATASTSASGSTAATASTSASGSTAATASTSASGSTAATASTSASGSTAATASTSASGSTAATASTSASGSTAATASTSASGSTAATASTSASGSTAASSVRRSDAIAAAASAAASFSLLGTLGLLFRPRPAEEAAGLSGPPWPQRVRLYPPSRWSTTRLQAGRERIRAARHRPVLGDQLGFGDVLGRDLGLGRDQLGLRLGDLDLGLGDGFRLGRSVRARRRMRWPRQAAKRRLQLMPAAAAAAACSRS